MLGGDAVGVPFRVFYYESWKNHYHVKPPWLVKDFVALAAALKVSESEQVARGAFTAYLASTDPFYEGHSPTKFLKSIGRWTVRSRPRSMHRDKMRDDGPYAERTKALQVIHAEVDRDATIPKAEKRNEAARRFRERFPV